MCGAVTNKNNNNNLPHFVYFKANTCTESSGRIRHCYAGSTITIIVINSPVSQHPSLCPATFALNTVSSTTQHILRVQVDNSAFRDGMFPRILTLLEEIKDTQRVHGRMIQTLLSRGDAPAVSVLPEGTVFPLKTVSDVQEM